MMTPEQKAHAKELIEMGEQIEAVRYFQETLHVSADQALALAEKLQQEMDHTSLEDKVEALKREFPKPSGFSVGKIVGSVFLSVGVIMLGIVTYLIISNNKFEQRAVHTKGKVIDYKNYQSSNDNGGSTTMYTPVFEYAFNGQSYQHTSSTSSSSPGYEIGAEVDVLVDPKNPREILINSFWEKWFVVVLLGFMGTIFSGVGYAVFRFVG
jgi:hypothetical protein